MKVVTHDDAIAFEALVRPQLVAAEAENNLFLGVASTLVRDPSRWPTRWMATVHDDAGAFVGAALWTPPFPLLLARAADDVVDALVDRVIDSKLAADGVQAIAPVADRFIERWRAKTSRSSSLAMRFGLYALERVVDPAWAAGSLRFATDDDVARVVPWIEAFRVETKTLGDPAEAAARRLVASQTLYVWEDDGTLATMAVATPVTPNGARIGYVYTPPELRGKRYASSCVAALSKRILDSGKRFAFLFTDMTNPTSNKIYQRIGYHYLDELHWHALGAPLSSAS